MSLLFLASPLPTLPCPTSQYPNPPIPVSLEVTLSLALPRRASQPGSRHPPPQIPKNAPFPSPPLPSAPRSPTPGRGSAPAEHRTRAWSWSAHPSPHIAAGCATQWRLAESAAETACGAWRRRGGPGGAGLYRDKGKECKRKGKWAGGENITKRAGRL